MLRSDLGANQNLPDLFGCVFICLVFLVLVGLLTFTFGALGHRSLDTRVSGGHFIKCVLA